MTPAPLQVGQAPSELALNSAGFTPLAFANALRIGSSSPGDVAGVLRSEPRAAPLQGPWRCPRRGLQGGAVVQVPTGERATGPQSLDGALKHHLATLGAGA